MPDYMPVSNYWEDDPDDREVIHTPGQAANSERPQYMPVSNYRDEEKEEPEPTKQPAQQVEVEPCNRMRRVHNSGLLQVPAHVMEARCSAEKELAAAMLRRGEQPVAAQRHEKPKFMPPAAPYWDEQ